MEKKKIYNNLGLKIIALLSAVVVWWVVMNIDDPLTKVTLTGISVELRNESELTDKGYIYDVTSGSTISVTVRAPESIAKDLKAADFMAYADLGQINPLTDSVNIEIECVKNDIRNQIVDISSKTQVVKLSIDNKETADIPVYVEIIGEPAYDYVIGDYSASQAKIQVTGAASVVETISRAVLSYDVSDCISSIYERVKPVFYDESGKEVDVSGIEVSRSTLSLSIDILPTKVVNVNVTPSGNVADGYRYMGYTQNIQQIKIAGTRENLNSLSSLDIPADAVVMDDIDSDQSYTVVIANYLSRVYKIVSDTKELIVNVDVEPLETRTFRINSGGIRVNNLADSLSCDILDRFVDIKITAIAEVLDGFNLDALNTGINLQGMGIGRYDNVIIEMSENDNFDVVGTYTVKVRVYDPERGYEDETETETQEPSTSSGKNRQ